MASKKSRKAELDAIESRYRAGMSPWYIAQEVFFPDEKLIKGEPPTKKQIVGYGRVQRRLWVTYLSDLLGNEIRDRWIDGTISEQAVRDLMVAQSRGTLERAWAKFRGVPYVPPPMIIRTTEEVMAAIDAEADPKVRKALRWIVGLEEKPK